MLTIEFGVTMQNLELLNNILDEASSYGIWSVFYGDEEISGIETIRNKVRLLRSESQQSNKPSVPLELNFKEGQVLKKVIIFYLTNNFKNLRRRDFETISDFILFVDDSLAFELEDKGF
jgi:hypothetical protein